MDALLSGSVDASMVGAFGCAVVCRGGEVEVEEQDKLGGGSLMHISVVEVNPSDRAPPRDKGVFFSCRY